MGASVHSSWFPEPLPFPPAFIVAWEGSVVSGGQGLPGFQQAASGALPSHDVLTVPTQDKAVCFCSLWVMNSHFLFALARQSAGGEGSREDDSYLRQELLCPVSLTALLKLWASIAFYLSGDTEYRRHSQ